MSRRRALGLVSLLAAGALTASGCGGRAQEVSLRPEARTFSARDYEKQYKRWTRSADDFSWGRLRDVLHVTATFESWEFRWAYVTRYAHDYSIDVRARDEMLRASLADAQSTHRFFVTLSGERHRETQLTGRRSAWRVLLVDEAGHQTEPVAIEFLRKPTAVEEVYFPSVHPQRNTFRIAFPALRPDGTPAIPEGSRSVRLRFAGPRGQVELVWKVDENGAPETPTPEITAVETSGGEVTPGTTAETPPDAR